MEIRWLFEADQDFDRIFTYLEKVSKQYAKRFLDKVIDIQNWIVTFPRIGRIVPEINEERIREVIFEKYRFIYVLKTNDIIEIMAIIHQKQEFRI